MFWLLFEPVDMFELVFVDMLLVGVLLFSSLLPPHAARVAHAATTTRDIHLLFNISSSGVSYINLHSCNARILAT